MRVAAAQYPIDCVASFEAYAAKQSDWIADARRRGAGLVLLPEYLGCELGGMLAAGERCDPATMLRALQPQLAPFLSLYRELAARYAVVIGAGTFLVEQGGRFHNRAHVFFPDGRVVAQDKLALTGYERSLAAIDPGDTPHVFELAGTRAGTAICYDCEFPLPVRAQVEAGARLLLVPSCTDTEAGATRVRIGCQARAMENQVFVLQSVTAGAASWNPVLDANTGSAAVYAPIDRGFPDDGLLARARRGERWAIADLDFGALDAVREVGQVANDRDWAAQQRPHATRAKLARGEP